MTSEKIQRMYILQYLKDNQFTKTLKMFKKEGGGKKMDSNEEKEGKVWFDKIFKFIKRQEGKKSESDKAENEGTTASEKTPKKKKAGKAEVKDKKSLKEQKEKQTKKRKRDQDDEDIKQDQQGEDEEVKMNGQDTPQEKQKKGDKKGKEKKNKKRKTESSEKKSKDDKAKEAAEAALKWAENIKLPLKGDKKKERKQGEAFRRVDGEKWSNQISHNRLADNSYEGTFGQGGYGMKALEKLQRVRGKDFRHEKTKRKRGTYRGGTISLESSSFKFND